MRAASRSVQDAADTLAQIPSLRAVHADRTSRHEDLVAWKIVDRNGRQHRVFALEVRGALGLAALSRLEGIARTVEAPVVVVADVVGPKLAAELLARGMGYVDAAGNCHVEVDAGRITLHIEGRRRTSRARTSGVLRAAGYRALFATLAQPDLSHATVRQLEASSGASRHAVAQLLGRLRDAGALLRTGRRGYAWTPRQRGPWMDRFVAGWADVLRARQLRGRYRLRTSGPELAEQILGEFLTDAGIAWGLGGSAGAMRMTRYFRDRETVVHVQRWSTAIAAKVGAVPDRDGDVVIFDTLGTLDLVSPVSGTAHPLLIHAELAQSPEPRAQDAARAVFDAFLAEA